MNKKHFEGELKSTREHFKKEISALRTNRATPALVEDIKIDYYGTSTPLKQTATITTPDARTILIQPWDKQNLAAVEKAFQKSDLGLNPSNDGEKIRISLPPLSEERREELVAILGKKKEETKVSIRAIREKSIRDLEAEESVSEDLVKQGKDEIQKMVDAENEEIEKMAKNKEEEIMKV